MIIGVAVKINNEVFSLPRPNRHNHLFEQLAETHPEYRFLPKIQGFISDDEKFLDRIEAAEEAIRCNQIQKLRWPPNLYSEDLW